MVSLLYFSQSGKFLVCVPLRNLGFYFARGYESHPKLVARLLLLVSSGDKLVRATELVKLVSMEKSVRGAIKLVTALKLPNLAERFNTILEVGYPSKIQHCFESECYPHLLRS